jgi:hypothetical protein
VGVGVAVNSHMHIVKNAVCITLYKVKKITEMYCHYNNLLSLKYKNVYVVHLKQAHSCNPSYSGGREKGDHISNPGCTNSSQHHTLKKSLP